MKHHYSLKNTRIILFSMLFTLLFMLPAKAQFVNLGQDPCNTRWRQIKTDHFQIIYPDFFEKNAQYIANIYEKLYAHANTLGIKAKKMSMIVRANGGISNGNAGWAPKKSELYTSPPQEVNSSWLQHLCVHEFRHVVQFDKVNQGFTKALYYIFGEQLTMAVIGIYIPMWFMEGDATVFETSVEHGGRGRSPEFLNQMKAQVTEKGIYTYYKAVLGSCKDFVPNHYTLGYYLVGNSRTHYGPRIWQDALTRVGKRPHGITPFARSLKLTLNEKRDSLWNVQHFQSLFINPDSVKKANTYCNAKRTLYRDNFSELQQIWKQEAGQIHHFFDTIPTRNDVYANYHYPTPTPTGEVIAYKEGLAQEGAFVFLKSKEDEIITRAGNLYDYKFAYNNHVLVWSEYKRHPRWQHGGKMVLATYDLLNRKYSRYPAPQNRYTPFSVNENWGFVEVDKENRASLVIMDTRFEKELFRLEGTSTELFVHPSHDGQGNIITIVVDERGKHIESVNIQTGKRTRLTANTYYEIDNPVAITGNQIIYRGAFNANNSFYCQNQPGNFGHHALNAKFGVRYPRLSRDRDSLYFSFYTSNGYKPAKIAVNQLVNHPVEKKHFAIAESVTRQEGWLFSSVPDSTYATRKYNKTLHLFNIHSWGPIFPDAEASSIDFGIAASSQNKLSTLSLTAGFVRSEGYKHGNWQVKASYSGLWPILNLEFKSGRRDIFQTYRFGSDTVSFLYKSKYTTGNATLQFPFNSSIKNHYHHILPYVRYKIQTIHDFKHEKTYRLTHRKKEPISIDSPVVNAIGKPDNITLQIMQYGLILNNQTRMSARDIHPRWGQRVEIGYEHTPFKNPDYGNSIWMQGHLYLPGFMPHHSLYLYAGHQNKSKKDRNYYENQIRSPRGISLHGHSLSSLHATYKMPIGYPDAHIGRLLYMKRIMVAPFLDIGQEKNQYYNKTFYSYGMEATLDGHYFQLPFPINLGFRAGYETKKKSMFVNMIFSVNFTI